MSDQPPPTPPTPGSSFCAECGAALPADARFCGSCGAAPPGAAAAPGAGADPTEVGGASTWQGVAPIVERDPTEALPTVPAAAPPPGPAAGPPPGPGGPPPGPPVGGPPTAPAPPGSGKGKGPLVAAIVVVLALLAGGAFFLLGGDDDGDDDEQAEIDREDDDEETTTTTEADDEATTTTTEEPAETSTTAVDDGAGDLTFVQRQDDSGTLVVEVPDFWEVDGLPLADGSPNLQAAESLAGLRNNFSSSGVSYTRLPAPNADPDATIDFLANANNLFDSCAVQEREDYSDGVFTGRSQLFSNCGSSGASIREIVGSRSDGVSVEVTTVVLPDDDPEIFNQIQRTFNLTA